MKRLIGGHVSFTKPINYLVGAVNEVIKIEGTVAAIFVGAPQSTTRAPFDKEMIAKAHKIADEYGVSIENFIVHAPYIVNIATSKPSYKWGIDFIIQEVKRTHELGIKYFNIHPGANDDVNIGISQCANAINKIIEKTKDVVILLETVTGKGTLIGRTFEEIKSIIDLVKDKDRVGVCMDTVHVWDAGYDIKNDLEGVLKKFDQTIGLEYLKGLHIGDSKNDLGSNKDRHANIGEGYIGMKALHTLVNHPKLKHLPMVLETPWDPDHKYKDEIKLLTK